jgi:glycosyltransferase involved in cell wall biosynthesis
VTSPDPGATARDLSVVVPVYRGQETLLSLVERLEAVLGAARLDYEILLVDDGSPDQSWKVIEELVAARPKVRGLALMRNYGQHSALLAGVRSAIGETIVTMDDDLQNPPEEVPRLLARLGAGFDVVYGTPRTMQHGMWRNLASRLTKLALQSMMGAETASRVSAFRAFRTDLRIGFDRYSGPFVSLDVLLTWSTSRFGHIEVTQVPRGAGESNYTFRMLVRHALNMLTGFSTWPLRVASLVGFLFTLFGAATLAFVVGRYFLQGSSVPGFPFLASVIAIFSGAQLFALGMIGEYVASIHFRTMDRPAYVVRGFTRPPASRSGV